MADQVNIRNQNNVLKQAEMFENTGKHTVVVYQSIKE